MRRPLLLVFLFASFHLYAQRLENIRAEAINGGERVVITYDLVGANPDQKYKVNVYSSHNNYSTSLSQVSGDLNDVTPGTGKRIEWNARGEMVEYSGDITFELRADPVSMPLTVRTPMGAKLGKNLTINYSGVAPGETVKLDLIKSGVVVNQVGTTTDPSKYTWSVPADVDKGSDYQIRLTSGTRTTTSGTFSVKSKIKPIWYLVPAGVVVVGVVVAVIAGKDKSDELPSPPDPSEID